MSLQAYIHSMRFEALGIISIELRPQDGVFFPAFTAGSHIDLQLPNGLSRSYSLCNEQSDQNRYVVAVLRDAKGRGGSICVHDQLRVGMNITISKPRNHFPLHDEAEHSILIAGGIGITPILCMARQLKAKGQSFEVLYFARSAKNAAFVQELKSLDVPLYFHFDDEKKAAPDLNALLSKYDNASNEQAQIHLYACGPGVMLDAFLNVTKELNYPNAHIERFNAQTIAPSTDAKSSYTVELKRSNRVLTITPELSLLDTLLKAGVEIPYSCCEGICGSCETKVLSGEVDHRDGILSPKEQASNKVMMVCVSGCKSAGLVLDL